MDFQLIDTNWQQLLDEAAKVDTSELRIVCPFIKKAPAEGLLESSPKSINVITRFNLCDFLAGVSDTSALRALMNAGASIRGVKGLHAKLYLFGTSRCVVTSANLTNAGLTKNHEFGFTAGEPSIIERCRQYFDGLWKCAGTDLTTAMLDEWDEKLGEVLATGTRPSKVVSLPDKGVDAGIVQPPVLVNLPVGTTPQAFVKLFGTSASRWERTRTVKEEIERSGSHWACSYSYHPRQVKDGAVMFMAKMVKEPNDIMIYGWGIALSHQDERDRATPEDIERRAWKKDWPIYIRVHHGEFINGTLGDGVSLNELMEALKSSSFRTTKLNAAKNRGNTDPRRAYNQKAQVELSEEGYVWLRARLEAAFVRNGKLPPPVLEKLDWPKLPAGVPAGAPP